MVSTSTKAGAHQHTTSPMNSAGKSKSNGKLDTSPSRAAAIRRGEIQISGPIPITDDHDREPTGRRSTVTTLHTRSDTSQQRVQLSREGSQTESAADHAHNEIDRSRQSSRNQMQPSPVDRIQVEEPIADGSSPHESGSFHSRNLHDSFRSTRSKPDSEKLGRKGGRLRVALRRLFGRKSLVERHRESQHSRETPEPLDPGLLPKVNQQTRPHNLQRSASAPAREVLRPAPLASNSPLPFADRPPNRDPEFNSLDTIQDEEGKGSPPALRNSLIFSPNEGVVYASWTGLAPRPASSHERSSRLIDPEAGIGFAVTSGMNPRRRSRSAGPAPKAREIGFGSPSPSIRRRRSDEIRYWRESSFSERPPLSPISLDKRSERAPEEMTQTQPEPPPQAFNFGPLIGEIKTMKITEAASLESRVKTLETKVANMQSAMWKFRGRPSGGVFTVPDLPKRVDGEDSIYSLSSVHTSQPLDQANKFTSEDLPRESPLEFIYPEMFLSTPESEPPRKERPLSLSTAIWTPQNQEGVGSLDENLQSPLPSVLTHEHFKSMITAIKREQKARRRLELQVSILQSLVEEMRQAGHNSNNNQTGRLTTSSAGRTLGGPQQSEPRLERFMEFEGAVGEGEGEDDAYLLDGYAASEDVFGTPLTQPLAEVPTPEQKEYFFSADVPPGSYKSAPQQETQSSMPTDNRLSLSHLTTRSVMELVG
ncbi:hypothetical protein FGG08_000795 [Glutinoglossum americanum]|uniref:Uncharacterized protein n=1 Tax=Glutinoglossum americanum TaxID=1670608 RepID=A0A9P8IHT2_9PEZI|nr:hypothetical protein FGG08_000795 [Glutinoglossum americanum]